MRQSVAAFALFRQCAGGRWLWLAQWNRHWQMYNFVGGHKHEDETFRDCVIREVSEELQLRPDADFTADREALAHFEYMAFSRSSRRETSYVIEVFRMELGNSEVLERLGGGPDNRWLSKEEIQSQHTGDGRPVSETMKMILDKLGWLE